MSFLDQIYNQLSSIINMKVGILTIFYNNVNDIYVLVFVTEIISLSYTFIVIHKCLY